MEKEQNLESLKFVKPSIINFIKNSTGLILSLTTLFISTIILSFVIVYPLSFFLTHVGPSVILHGVDTYFRIISTSWPLVNLIIGITLLITQREAISEFIIKRMTSVGFDGIKGGENPEEINKLLLTKQKISEETTESDQPVNTSVISPPSSTGSNTLTLTSTASTTPATSLATNTTSNLADTNETLLKYLNFEKIYNIIFGTQIAILDSLRKDAGGLFFNAIASVYEQWRQNDELLKSYSLSDYIKFLESNLLIFFTENNGIKTYFITAKGIEFLDYIEENSYLKNKPH